MRPFRLLLPIAASLAVGCLCGCAGYRLGPTNGIAAGTKTLQLKPFLNHTLEPGIGDAVTTACRRSLQQDGTFQLATHGDADVVVNGVVTRYTRRGLSFLSQDVLTVRDFRVAVTVRITARDTVTGRTLLDSPVTGYALVRAGSDLASAERQARPVLAQDVADKVTALLVDGTW